VRTTAADLGIDNYRVDVRHDFIKLICSFSALSLKRKSPKRRFPLPKEISTPSRAIGSGAPSTEPMALE